MKKIVVSVTNDLVTDQRVAKICNVLHQMGFSILLIGRKLPNTLPIHRPYKTYRFRLLFNKGFLFYAEYNIRLFFKLLFIKSDILVANDLDTLLPNFLTSKLFGRKLVYDSHELFSEIPELVERKRVKKIWFSLEKFLIPSLNNCYTVSKSISKYYKQMYNSDFKVVKNVPYKKENNLTDTALREQFKGKNIIIYQGSVNIGRGLELAISSMEHIENTILLIIGDGDILSKLKNLVTAKKLTDSVHFLGRITPNKLKTYTSQADVGISLEEDLGLNYRYALPNKLFDYIQARCPVLVSNLPEMKKIVETYKVGEILTSRTPENLAKTLSEMLEKGKNHWETALENTAQELIWETESQKIKEIYNNLK